MAAYYFTDIDLTLLQSKRWIRDDVPLTTAAFDVAGRARCFFTPQQRAMVALLEHADHVIPVTARDSASLARVQIPFTDYKVVSHGALILTPENEVLPQWLARNQIDVWSARINEVYTRVAALFDGTGAADLRHWVVVDHEIPVYIAVKGDADVLASLVPELSRIWHGDGALIHHNGREMALLPPFARKERAVDFLMEQILARDPHALFIGAGDSRRDLPFMKRCHYLMIPGNSQIASDLP